MNKMIIAALFVLSASVANAQPVPTPPAPSPTPAPNNKEAEKKALDAAAAAAKAKAAAEAAAKAAAGNKDPVKNSGSGASKVKIDYSVAIPSFDIALVEGEPAWTGKFDGDMPPTTFQCPVERPIGAGIGSVARVGKVSQQRFEYFRSKSATRPEAWTARGGIPAYAGNVTPNQGQPRLWCVKSTISPSDFDKLSQFLDLLDGMDWVALTNLLKDAENLARQEWVQTQINSAVGPLKGEITAIRTTIALLTKRVEVLESDMKEVKGDVKILKKRRITVDVGVAGLISPPANNGRNMSYSAMAVVAPNFPIGDDSSVMFRPQFGAGVGYDKQWGITLMAAVAFLWNVNGGSVYLGPVAHGSTTIFLNSPGAGSYAPDSNAGLGPELLIGLGQNKKVWLDFSGDVGVKIQNGQRNGYYGGFGGEVVVGIVGRI